MQNEETTFDVSQTIYWTKSQVEALLRILIIGLNTNLCRDCKMKLNVYLDDTIKELNSAKPCKA